MGLWEATEQSAAKLPDGEADSDYRNRILGQEQGESDRGVLYRLQKSITGRNRQEQESITEIDKNRNRLQS